MQHGLMATLCNVHGVLSTEALHQPSTDPLMLVHMHFLFLPSPRRCQGGRRVGRPRRPEHARHAAMSSVVSPTASNAAAISEGSSAPAFAASRSSR